MDAEVNVLEAVIKVEDEEVQVGPGAHCNDPLAWITSPGAKTEGFKDDEEHGGDVGGLSETAEAAPRLLPAPMQGVSAPGHGRCPAPHPPVNGRNPTTTPAATTSAAAAGAKGPGYRRRPGCAPCSGLRHFAH